MEFFTTLETLLQLQAPHEKISQFQTFYKNYLDNTLSFDHTQNSKIFTNPSYQNLCEIVDAKKMPKRTALSTTKGKAYLVHNIAHIEYSAIDLALDHAYRYKNMPKSFYDDWLEVADDEIRHFLILESLLKENGYSYGDFGVHSFLFDISMKSLDLVTRMAAVPRYLEASGLDSNPKMIEKLSHHEDSFAKDIIKALEIILAEEVDHVKKGDIWFKWACKKEAIDPQSYFDIVEKVLPGAKKQKPYVNIKDRQKAGFTCSEISVLTDESCKD
ncbi:MAG: ferritin-like domain-containing protein [Epsilonproteobacteria bacterium]|nr:ferritin-like domain-containing protein [Campylobacterota bacterium]